MKDNIGHFGNAEIANVEQPGLHVLEDAAALMTADEIKSELEDLTSTEYNNMEPEAVLVCKSDT
jgi:hypothetical protein